jgi:DNA repair protein RecO (recombination protein O)
MEREQERRQRLYRVSAIVLKRRDMGEADRLLTVLARERGKLTLLAKGVRKPASRKAGHIEPFTHVDLLVAKGKSLDLVTQAETISAHRRLREDLWRSSLAYYVVELVDAFTQEADPNALVFDLLLETLGRLDEDTNPTLAVRYGEIHLLGLVGYQPQLFRCVHCDRLLKPETNYFSLELGGALCPEHRAVGPTIEELPLPVLKVLRFMQTRDWEQVAPLQLRPELGREVEAVLARYIAYHLERSLRSTPFLERLREARAVLAGRQGANAQGQPPSQRRAPSANERGGDAPATAHNPLAARGPGSPPDGTPTADN